MVEFLGTHVRCNNCKIKEKAPENLKGFLISSVSLRHEMHGEHLATHGSRLKAILISFRHPTIL